MSNRIWWKRWSILTLLAAALLLVITGVAYAVVSVDKTVPAGVTVKLDANPQGALGFYSDSDCTQPVTKLNFGELKPGFTGVVSLYVKNLTSGTDFRYFSVTDDFEYGSTSIYPYNYSDCYKPPSCYFDPGEIGGFDFYLNLNSDTPVGLYNFTVTVNAKDTQ